MPASYEIEKEFNPTSDVVLKYMTNLSKRTERNILIYYSGFLQYPNSNSTAICDEDMQGFMNAFYKLDKAKGLDLILHTPGGSVAAAESLGNYMRSVFSNNINCYVPHMAMSCGTMLAFACRKIFMGKSSSLGPTDPAFGRDRVDAVIEEFEMAKEDISKNPNLALLWQPILTKNYTLGFYGECVKAKKLSEEVSRNWLETGMFKDDQDKSTKVKKILDVFNSHQETKIHDRRIPIERAKELGLDVNQLEDDADLQDLIMSIHHSLFIAMKKHQWGRCIINQNGNGQMYPV